MSHAFITRRGGSGGSGKGTPIFTYTGSYELVDDNGNTLQQGDNTAVFWKLRLLTSGSLMFNSLGSGKDGVDVFLVGAGGGGSPASCPRPGGGGGGYTLTDSYEPAVEIIYTCFVGECTAAGLAGGSSSIFGISAAGGNPGLNTAAAAGGNGGSGGGGASGGAGGSDGAKGSKGAWTYGDILGGSGQIAVPGPNGETGSTREFGMPAPAILYAGGGSSLAGVAGGAGGGGAGSVAGAPNTGGGGGANAIGGSGIVIIRNQRGATA